MLRLLFVFAFAALSAVNATAWTLAGRVVGIADGDTLTILDAEKRQHVIRLQGIDAPEKTQPFGSASKRHLSDLAFGLEAVAECGKTDRYRRNVCRVMVGAVDVCLAQVRAGLAWHFKRYERELTEERRRTLTHAEASAREEHVGVWSASDQLAPWDWRTRRGEGALTDNGRTWRFEQ
jgi:endonuclease YncB( thermonuclease family)